MDNDSKIDQLKQQQPAALFEKKSDSDSNRYRRHRMIRSCVAVQTVKCDQKHHCVRVFYLLFFSSAILILLLLLMLSVFAMKVFSSHSLLDITSFPKSFVTSHRLAMDKVLQCMRILHVHFGFVCLIIQIRMQCVHTQMAYINQ